jgi:hypothetical protein
MSGAFNPFNFALRRTETSKVEGGGHFPSFLRPGPGDKNVKPASSCKLAGLVKSPNHALVRLVSLRLSSSAPVSETSETFPLKGILNFVNEGRIQASPQARLHNIVGIPSALDLYQQKYRLLKISRPHPQHNLLEAKRTIIGPRSSALATLRASLRRSLRPIHFGSQVIYYMLP